MAESEAIPLQNSRFSVHFNILRYIGLWMTESRKRHRIIFYAVYKFLIVSGCFTGLFSLLADLYCVLGDFKQMTWNLCLSVFFIGGMFKSLNMFHNNEYISRMRVRLHRCEISSRTPEDEEVNLTATKELRTLELLFYSTGIVLVPLWLLTMYLSYLWGPKKLPIPFRFPFEFDYDDDVQYNTVFFVSAFFGCLAVYMVMETELSTFSLLIQITREYNRFLVMLTKVNEMYGKPPGCEFNNGKTEMNPYLRKIKTKMLLRDYCKKQQQLIQCTKDFELSYSFTMLLQVFVPSVLIIVSSIQCILEYDSISMNISYQMGYICMVFTDVFLLCWFATRIRGQCLKVGDEAYSILWYEMDVDIQRDICMIIMRAQVPPKITSGKVMEMNLHAFMLMARNIYSWLALFQQLAFKTKSND